MARLARTKGLYDADTMMQLHKSQDNVVVTECYAKFLQEPGSKAAHKLLHTAYQNRRRTHGEPLVVLDAEPKEKLVVSVCVGTSCFLRGAQSLLRSLATYVESEDLEDQVEVQATFCFEKCNEGPTVHVGGQTIQHCTLEAAVTAIKSEIRCAAPLDACT
jgi:NADH-quinone oxidoreductase subunit G